MRTIVVSLLIVIAVVTSKYLDTVQRPKPEVRVDTLRIVTTVYDTTRVETTIVSRAADTIRVKDAEPLTHSDLVHIVCENLDKVWKDAGRDFRLYGDDRDRFAFNPYGQVFCPQRDK